MTPEPKPPTNGGLGHILGQLLSSGDNWTKAIIIGGLLLNTWLTKHNGSGINENSEKLLSLRTQIAREVRVIYNNQDINLEHIQKAEAYYDAVMDKLGIRPPKTQIIRVPEKLPDYDEKEHK